MATINLGRVKPVFRGAYSGATAYVVDDIVTYSNETYICILASTGNLPTNGTYWTKLAAKGTDGTDLTTTLTTQGDILYRDASGLQRLGIGTAGQALLVNSGATALEWGSGGKNVKHTYVENSTRSTSYHEVSGGNRLAFWNFTFTKYYTNSILLCSALFPYTTEGGRYPHQGVVGLRFSTTNYDSNGSDQDARFGYMNTPNNTDGSAYASGTFLFNSASTNISGTGTIYVRNFIKNYNSTDFVGGFRVYNPKQSDDSRGADTFSYFSITEFEQ